MAGRRSLERGVVMASSKDGKGASAAAAKRAEIVAKQRRDNKRNMVFAGLGAVLIAAVVVAVGLFIAKAGVGGAYQNYGSGDYKAPSAADESGGIFVGKDGIAGGSEANEDAVRIDLYEDPICPACGAFNFYTGEELTALRESGDIALYYHPISYFDNTSRNTKYSTRAVNALATVAEYDPANFEAFWHALFLGQPEEGTKGLTNEEIAAIATEAGVSAEAIAKIADGEFTEWVASVTELASKAGVGSTPSILLNGSMFPAGQWAQAGTFTWSVDYIQREGDAAFNAILPNLEPYGLAALKYIDEKGEDAFAEIQHYGDDYGREAIAFIYVYGVDALAPLLPYADQYGNSAISYAGAYGLDELKKILPYADQYGNDAIGYILQNGLEAFLQEVGAEPLPSPTATA